MPDFMEWSREIINSLMKKNNINVGDPYRVKITYNPNPLDFDGIDQVIIEVIKVHKISFLEEILFSTEKEYCINIEEAAKKVNDWLKKELKEKQ